MKHSRAAAVTFRGTAFLAVVLVASLSASQPSRRHDGRIEEFAGLIEDFSEPGGYFRSDNFTSNETSYQHVADKLRELKHAGGAYLGVGPEQNFTYIAITRPEIAFIVDVRRQAMLQHLLYKAVFHASPNRASFLSNLLCRPPPPKSITDTHSLDGLLEYFASAPAPEQLFRDKLEAASRRIQTEFRVRLSEDDLQRLEYVYSAFWRSGLAISFRFGPTSWGGGYGGFPTLRDLLLQRDLHGVQRSFLVTDADYQFVRELHLHNRIIPIVGDFAGSKAIASVGDYLRRNRYTVRTFYTSNVEQFLFRNGVYDAFAANLKKLPFDQESVIIRAVPARGQHHPAQVPGHRITTVLQRIGVLLRDYGDGTSTNYWNLVTTDYIAGEK